MHLTERWKVLKLLQYYLKFFYDNYWLNWSGLSVCGYCFQETTDQNRIFFNYWEFWLGFNIPTLLELLAIFSNLECGLKFTFTISVTGMVDNVNVGYACITTKIYVDQVVCLKVSVHRLITSITTYSQ